MPSLKDFVAALQVGWFPALAAFIGCAIVVLGDFYQIPYLKETPQFVLNAAVIVGVFSFSILAANIAYAPVAIWKALRRRLHAREFKKMIISEIEAAPKDEKYILAYLISSGRKVFTAEFNDSRLAPLVAKGILSKESGYHDVLEWPYMVQEEAWIYLLENRERYFIKDASNQPDPFSWKNIF